MTTVPCTVRLYEKRLALAIKRAEKRYHLDPKDDERLGEVLDEMAVAHGGKKVDLSRYRIDVFTSGMRRVVRFETDDAGRWKATRP